MTAIYESGVFEPQVQAQDQHDTGVNEQEPAEPVRAEEAPPSGEEISASPKPKQGRKRTAGAAETSAGNTTEETPPSDEAAPQSPKENAKYAGIRRKAEAEAMRKAEKEVEEKLRQIGIVDPETGKPIQNREEYEALRKARMDQERHAFMKQYNMDEKQYYDFVGSLPEIRAARIARERAVNTQVQTQISDELRQIHELDSSIQSLEDLQRYPSYDKMLELVKGGNRLIDAFKLANFDSLTRLAATKEKQAALNSLRGKAHLTPVSRRQGGGLSPVPDPVMNQYRIFNPSASEEEIQRHYNNELKSRGLQKGT